MSLTKAETLAEYPSALVDGGMPYLARACGRRRDDGLWDGWIEFERADGIVVETERETTQPNRTDLLYWATGLTPVYLEGAFGRASDSPPTAIVAAASR
jgi:hypothetical protein